MLAHATRSDDHAPAPVADSGPAHEPADSGALALSFIRYLDVVLVAASTPFVLLASLPALGFAIGAGAWIVTRYAVAVVERRAWSARDIRVRSALHLAAILGRVWLVALAVLAARFAAGNADGITAAVVVLAAFTVELVIKLALRRSIVPRSGGPS
jgi:hypothetical protein